MKKAERTRADLARQLTGLMEAHDTLVEKVEKLLEEGPLKPQQFTEIRTLSKEIKHRHHDLRYYVTLLAMLEMDEQSAGTQALMSDLWNELEETSIPKKRLHRKQIQIDNNRNV